MEQNEFLGRNLFHKIIIKKKTFNKCQQMKSVDLQPRILSIKSFLASCSPVYLLLCDPIITLETKLTIALAGCSGSCSANR